METQAQLPTHPFAGPKIVYRTSTMDPKQRFYHHFLDTVAVLQDQVSQLEFSSNIGGERQSAIDHVLAGISKLQNEVSDAAEFTPAYDRRQYAEAVRDLQDTLNTTIAKVTPKSRFQFKRSTHVDMGAPENDPRFNPGSHAMHSRPDQDFAAEDTPEVDADTVPDLPAIPHAKDYNEEMARPSSSSVRKPSFSASRDISIAQHAGLHIILPASAARATAAGSLTDLRDCVVDMSVPTAQGKPFPGLALKNIAKSLIVAGRVAGSVHITGVTDSIVVVTARQVRIHECKNVDLYLHCGSHPIIEDCSGMRFAPLPPSYATEAEKEADNQWDQVDDFKWLKAGHSPNWTVMSEAERLGEEIWTKTVPGQPGVSVNETLKKVGLPRY